MARLQNGLEKLHKTRSDVDVLVKLAGAKAEEVEQKVQAADAVAVEVSFLLQMQERPMTYGSLCPVPTPLYY